MRRSFKYRLYPTGNQVERLRHTLDICRELYNAALAERRIAWKRFGRSLTDHGQRAQLPPLKELRPDVAEVYSQVLQDVLCRLDKTFQALILNLAKSILDAGWGQFLEYAHRQSGGGWSAGHSCEPQTDKPTVCWLRGISLKRDSRSAGIFVLFVACRCIVITTPLWRF